MHVVQFSQSGLHSRHSSQELMCFGDSEVGSVVLEELISLNLVFGTFTKGYESFIQGWQ